MKNSLLSLAALALSSPALAQDEAAPEPALAPQPAPAPSPSDYVNGADQSEWVVIAPADMLVMTLADAADGTPRRVVMQLMPKPFSQGWVENIRTLARAKWYDGTSINRVQDNYVVQWGDPNYDNPETGGKAKPLPEGLKVMGEDEYSVDEETLADATYAYDDLSDLRESLPPSVTLWVADRALEAILANPDISPVEQKEAIKQYFEITENVSATGSAGSQMGPEEIAKISINATVTELAPEGWHQRDGFAEWVEFWKGWPIANAQIGTWLNENDEPVEAPRVSRREAAQRGIFFDAMESWFWPVHCYGMVGVGRNYSPDTGSGAELYTVIGHAPRHLDRNIALVGRIISGMEHLSSLPRGNGALGFYTAAEADKRTPILSIRVASDLPEEQRPQYEYLSTETETFARYAEARANRRDPFFITPAGGADICNIPVPVRSFEYVDDETE